MKNAVQLITYADRLGKGDIKTLHRLLNGPFAGLFGGVHLLPFFYPIHGVDAGFDPIDHRKVDPSLGKWQDIKELGQDVELIADLIVNHVSSSSPEFRDYDEKGEGSAYRDLFLTLGSIFPNGATERDLLAIYRPRPGLPFTPVTFKNGQKRLLWTTFAKEQIDINVLHPAGKEYLQTILHTLRDNGIGMVRLDAVGYAIKKPGTSCFMIPEAFDFIADLARQAAALDIQVLVEIHAYYHRQIDIAQQVDRVYDFVLPPLVLHAIFNHTSHYLKHWLEISPRNSISVLDTHDGIGVMDIGADYSVPDHPAGLIPPDEIADLIERIHLNSNGQSRLSTVRPASGRDYYQVNCTYYDALGRKDSDYILARAIQFFSPGIPQVYYVGLLAGENDMDLLDHTGIGRDINRHYYTLPEIEQAIRRPVVQALFELIRFRNSHPAFQGSFSMGETSDSTLTLRWDRGADWAMLEADFASGSYSVSKSPLP